MRNAVFVGLLAISLTGGCSTLAPPPETVPDRQITIERGPCFGFCPVFKVVLTNDGMVLFDGDRHTSVLGHREKRILPATVRAIEAALAPIRPASPGQSATPCEAVPSDTASVTVRWSAAGVEDTALTYRKGCLGAAGKTVDARIEAALELLDIDDWAAQKTRDGVPRG
jgi:hypothetical protein